MYDATVGNIRNSKWNEVKWQQHKNEKRKQKGKRRKSKSNTFSSPLCQPTVHDENIAESNRSEMKILEKVKECQAQRHNETRQRNEKERVLCVCILFN